MKEIPFQLCPLEGNEVSVLVCDPQSASGLTLHERFISFSFGLRESLGNYFRGKISTGLMEKEEILSVGTILTGVGKLTLNNKGEMTLGPPENGSKYFLSRSGYEDILHQQESLAYVLRSATFLFGALGIVVASVAIYRAYQRYKEKQKRQDSLDDQQ